jgi:hypothetical protein
MNDLEQPPSIKGGRRPGRRSSHLIATRRRHQTVQTGVAGLGGGCLGWAFSCSFLAHSVWAHSGISISINKSWTPPNSRGTSSQAWASRWRSGSAGYV